MKDKIKVQPTEIIGDRSWKKVISRYQKPDNLKSWIQVLTSLVPYILFWILMVVSVDLSYWLTLLLAIPTAGFMIRVFIIFHDCGHGSFFKSRRANDILGIITGIMTFTPYYHWRHNHAVHHATVGNLDRRGVGDVWTLTVQEYQESSTIKKLLYRIVRNPAIMFTVGPVGVFLFGHRFVKKQANKRERNSVYWTNFALFGILIFMGLTIGLKTYILVQLPIMIIGTSIGVWLFYVQHQFEDVYWERSDKWDFYLASLKGSSYYKLPRIFQWFTGNIGFHHVHHISPKVPNYFLERCHLQIDIFQQVKPITILKSLKSLRLHLYDEEKRKLITFAEFSKLRKSYGV